MNAFMVWARHRTEQAGFFVRLYSRSLRSTNRVSGPRIIKMPVRCTAGLAIRGCYVRAMGGTPVRRGFAGTSRRCRRTWLPPCNRHVTRIARASSLSCPALAGEARRIDPSAARCAVPSFRPAHKYRSAPRSRRRARFTYDRVGACRRRGLGGGAACQSWRRSSSSVAVRHGSDFLLQKPLVRR
ncbi:hypothetical protein P3T21_001340 [Paraburkholderia sp. GAS334]